MWKKFWGILLAVLLLTALLINSSSMVYASTSLKIIKQPVSVTVSSGSTAKITVSATGDGLSYKWYYKNAGDAKFSRTTTFAGNYYTVKMNDSRAGRQIYCIIADKYGSSVKTNTVTLSMGNTLKITKQPVSVTAPGGSTAKVTFSVTGDGLTYKWYYKNAGDAKFTRTTTFSGNYYTATMNSSRAGRQIYCVITDKYGSSVKTNTVTLTMGNPLKITKQPVSVTAPGGTTAKVTVSATGDGLTYKWYFKNAGDNKFTRTTTFSGNYYTVKMNNSRAGRQVYCVITDKYGSSVKTNTVSLIMGNPLKITKQPVSVTVSGGSTAKVTFSVTGDGLTYKWYFKNAGDTKFTRTATFTGNSYTVSMNKSRDGRQIYCVISDKHGNSVKTNTVILSMVHVYDDGVIARQPTCSIPGEKVYTCRDCYKKVVEVISKTGHDMGEWKVIRDATATTEGLERSRCSKCSYYKDRRMEMLKPVYYITVNTGVGETSEVGVGKNGKYSLDAPSRVGYVFKGWKDSDGKVFSSSGTISGNVNVNAVWEVEGTDTLAELIERTDAGVDCIVITSNITINQPVFISYETTIYADENYTLKRDPDYAGDIFVVGQDRNGESAAVQRRKAVLTLGGGNGTLTIDGSKDELNVKVVGSAVFVSDSATLNIYDGVCIANNKKLGNDRILKYDTLTSVDTLGRAGGAAVLNLNATVNMYGGVLENNIVATEHTIITNEEGVEVSKETNGCGGAVYNRGNFNMYGGTISCSEALRGGGIYSDRIAYLYAGTVSDNVSHTYGGGVSSSSSSNADMFIGSEGNGATMLFSDNHSMRAGGALYSNTSSPIIIYGNAEFVNNRTDTSGGAVYTAGPLTVRGATFTGNSCEYSGGAIYHHYSNSDYNRRYMTLTDCVFESNRGGLGGAVILSAGVEGTGTYATITDCKFLKNQAVVTSTNPGNGGAIYVTRNGEATIKGCTFVENTAAQNAGAIAIHSGSEVQLPECSFIGNTAVYGGALYTSSDSVVNMTELEFTDNSATHDANGNGGNGGAVYISGATVTLKNVNLHNNTADNHAGAIYQGACDLTLDSTCEFDGNRAGNHGGAIYITYKTNEDGSKDGSTLDVIGVTFKNNSALAGGAISGRSATVLNMTDVKLLFNSTPNAQMGTGNGGGAVYANNSTININNVTFDGNSSGYYGGAVKADACDVVIKDTSILNNSGGTGGAVYASAGTLSADNVTLTGNTAALNGVMYLTSKEALLTDIAASGNTAVYGGVLYANTNSKVNVKDSELIGNNANSGGAIYVAGGATVNTGNSKLNSNNATTGHGGAIYVTGAALNVNTNTEFIGNTSLYHGGAISVNDKVNEQTQVSTPGTANITDVTFNGNSGSNGGAVYFNDSTYTVTDCTFTENTSTSDTYGGGAVYNTGATGTMDKVTFIGNTALRGGAVALYTNSQVTVSNVTATNNEATSDGGAFYVNKGKLDLTKDTVILTDNKAKHGGAVYATTSDVDINNARIENNSASTNGGAVYAAGGTLDITGSSTVISGNEAKEYGGAIYVSYVTSAEQEKLGCVFNITDGIVSGNKALYGGAISGRTNSNITLKNTLLSNNSTPDASLENKAGGGAIYTNNSVLTLSNVNVTGNSSGYYGGAISTVVTEVILKDDTKLVGNSGGTGGALYLTSSSSLTATGLTVTDNTSTANGVIYLNGNNFKFTSLTASDNTAQWNGGVLYINGSKTNVTIDGAKLEHNDASSGGAVSMKNGSLTLNNTIVSDNKATGNNGGAISIAGSNLTVSGTNTFIGNSAANHGGAVYVSYTENEDKTRTPGVLIMTDGLFESNSAVAGGAVSIRSACEASFDGTSFIGNSVSGYADENDGDGEGGGAIYVGFGKLTLTNVTATNNIAAETTVTGTTDTEAETTSLGFGGVVDAVKSTVTVTGGIFSSNKASNGGAFYALNGSDVSFSGTTLSENESTYVNSDYNNRMGGGAVNIEGGSLTVSGTTLDSNKTGYYGGAVLASGVTVTIDGNSVVKGSAGATGAALHFKSSSTVTLTDTEIANNIATGNGVVYVNNSAVNMTNITASGNSANSGGVIYTSNQNTKITVNSSTFTNNSVKKYGGVLYAEKATVQFNGGELFGNSATNGGVVYSDNANISFDGSTLKNNTATQSGGAINTLNGSLEIKNAVLSENDATNHGGAVYISRTNVTMNDAQFSLNKAGKNGGAFDIVGAVVTATGDCKFTDNTAEGHGGAVYVTYFKEEGSETSIPSILNMTDGFFKNNTAMGGGAVSIRSACEASFDGTSFIGNSVSGYADENDGDGEGGGAIYVGFGKLTLTNVTATNNIAAETTVTGTTDIETETTSLGFGGVVDAVKSTVTVTGGIFSSNKASNGGAFYALNGSDVSFSGTTLSENESTYVNSDYNNRMGGGAVNIEGGSLTATGVTMDLNTTGYYGAAIHASKATVKLNGNSAFTNSTGTTGAALYFRNSCNVTMENVTVSNNSADSNGVIYQNGGTLDMTNVTASGNKASNGGVLYTSGGSTKVTLKDTAWSGNSAKSGGAIYLLNDATVTITNSEMKENTANLGGAIYNRKGSLETLDTLFIGNTATMDSSGGNGNGGAIVLAGGTFTAAGTNKFSDNSAENHGGAVYVSYAVNDDETREPGVMTMTDGLFENNSAVAGGAISSRTGCEVTLNGTELKNNSASGTANDVGGGAIFTNNNTLTLSGVILDGNSTGYYGGAVSALGATVTIKDNSRAMNNIGTTGVALHFRDSGTYTLTDISLTDNIGQKGSGVIYITGSGALNITGLTASGNKSNNGGVIYSSGSATVTVNNSNLSNNIATNVGGAIDHRSGGALTVSGTTISGNSAKNGGALNTAGKGITTVKDSYLSVNSATEFGGAVNHGSGGKLDIVGTAVTGNSAVKNGGAVYAIGTGMISVSGNSSFNNNTAVSAGAIYLDQGASATISDTTFEGNTATGGDGGAIVVADSGEKGTLATKLTMTNATLKNNTASAKGGALSTDTASPNLVISANGCTFSSNAALGAGGGAVEIQNGNQTTVTDPAELKLTFNNCSFTGNTAKTTGGAIEIRTNSCAKIDGITATGNKSTDNGGVIYVTSNYSRLYLTGTVTTGDNTAKNGTFVYLYNKSYTNPPMIYTTHSSSAAWYSEVKGNRTSVTFDLTTMP